MPGDLSARARVLLPLAPLLRAAGARRNILLIAVDDLNTDLGCYGHPMVLSPHIDALARRGTRFDRAWCQYPVCNPSRTSLLSGRYPESTGILDNRTNPRANLRDSPFLPEYLRSQGYFSAAVGKVYHDGMDGPNDWDTRLDPSGTRPNQMRGEGRNLTGGKFAFFRWMAAEDPEQDHADFQIASEAIRLLETRRDQPFFLAVGFRKPHDPYIAPKRYFEPYPLDRIPPPQGPTDDEADIPAAAYPPVRHNLDGLAGREFRRAYYACVSFMDAQVGRLLAAMQKRGLAENTLTVFFGDNGLHLGEHGWWNKVTLFERSTRIPLIVAGCEVQQPGLACRRPVQLLDLYPTLLAANGLPSPPGLQGRSLLPLLGDPEAPWDHPAYSVVTRAGTLGRSIQTGRFRYTEWNQGAELYDHASDPHEYRNLAQDPAYRGTVQTLRRSLRSIGPPRPR